jgi:hypothetical protein
MVAPAVAPTIISSETFKVPPEISKVPPSSIFNAAVLSLVSPKLTVPPSISRVPP